MKTMWFVNWEDLSVGTTSFEKAVEYVEKEMERIGFKDSLTIIEDEKGSEERFTKWRVYEYQYSFEGKMQIAQIAIYEIEVI